MLYIVKLIFRQYQPMESAILFQTDTLKKKKKVILSLFCNRLHFQSTTCDTVSNLFSCFSFSQP